MVEVAETFPQECRYVLEMPGGVYHNDGWHVIKSYLQKNACSSTKSAVGRRSKD